MIVLTAPYEGVFTVSALESEIELALLGLGNFDKREAVEIICLSDAKNVICSHYGKEYRMLGVWRYERKIGNA